jgi:putative ABC transport system ATP-binding protein
MQNTPLLQIRNLNHYFGQGKLQKQILFDINLDVRPGEIIIIEGPSGSGKTTLLTLIGGLRTVQSGSLRLFGQPLNGANEQQLMRMRRNIGYIFQAHNLVSFLTARQNVNLSLELHGRGSRKAIDAQSHKMLHTVGLGEHGNHYPDQLSGGQKQRVAIARALAPCPKMILADEPTASLDKQSGRAVVDLMQHLAKAQGSAVLLVTHDHRIIDVADRIIQMEDGRLTSLNRRTNFENISIAMS